MNQKKKELGQFFTKKSKHIIGDLLHYIESDTIVDPFCGEWDILNLFDENIYKLERVRY